MNNIEIITDKLFEEIKHIDEHGDEYWEARELQKILDYKEWRKFNLVISKAMRDYKNSNKEVVNHFVVADKMVIAGATTKKILDYKLS